MCLGTCCRIPGGARARDYFAVFGIKIKVPGWKRSLGMAASVIHPRLKLPNQIDSYIFRTTKRHAKPTRKDPAHLPYGDGALVHRDFWRSTAPFGDRLRSLASRCCFLQTGDDQLVDSQAAQQVFVSVGATRP